MQQMLSGTSNSLIARLDTLSLLLLSIRPSIRLLFGAFGFSPMMSSSFSLLYLGVMSGHLPEFSFVCVCLLLQETSDLLVVV